MTYKENKVAKHTNENIIRYVPSLSSRKNTVAKHLNAILQEKPEYINTIYALLTYSTQKWASDMRKKIGFTEDTIDALENDTRAVFEQLRNIINIKGIRPFTSSDHFFKLAESDKILECIEEAVEWIGETPDIGENLKKVIRAVHFMDEDEEDVSLFLVNRYYDIAVQYIHDGYGNRINGLISNLSSYDWLEEDMKYSRAYHNTQLLIKIYPTLCHRYMKHAEIDNYSNMLLQRDANGLHLIQNLVQAVDAIKYYGDQGEELHTILDMMMNMEPDYKIEEALNCKTSTLRYRKAKAINLLSFVLWGYSTSQILQGCIYRN